MTDRSAIGKKSKAKGKRYERHIAKILTDFTGVNFRKIPGSGGFNKTGGVVVADHAFSGDVICDDPGFLYSIEAKNRKNYTLTSLIKSPPTAPFTEGWYQCLEDAKRTSRKPIMFFKPNHNDDWLCFRESDFLELGLDKANHFVFNVYRGRILRIRIRKKGSKERVEVNTTLPDPFVVDWNEFKKHISPESLFNAVLREKAHTQDDQTAQDTKST
jgi:hypothetical protein